MERERLWRTQPPCRKIFVAVICLTIWSLANIHSVYWLYFSAHDWAVSNFKVDIVAVVVVSNSPSISVWTEEKEKKTNKRAMLFIKQQIGCSRRIWSRSASRGRSLRFNSLQLTERLISHKRMHKHIHAVSKWNVANTHQLEEKIMSSHVDWSFPIPIRVYFRTVPRLKNRLA